MRDLTPTSVKEKFLRIRHEYRGIAVGFRCDLVLLPNKKKAVREYLTHPGAIAVIPFLDSPGDVPLDEARVVMVQQYRYPVNKITEELPAGKLDGKESLLSCLDRELREETGFSSKKFHKLLSYWPTPAFANEIIHVFWAEDLKKGKMSPDEDEFLSVSIQTFGNLLKKIKEGKIQDSKTMLGLLAFSQFAKSSSGKGR